jgi:glycopeptide antibiotics resistance protein
VQELKRCLIVGSGSEQMGYYSQQLLVTIAIAVSVLIVSTFFRFASIHFQRRQLGTVGFWFINTIGSLIIIFTFTLATIGVRNYEMRQVVWIPFAGGEYSNVNTQLSLIKLVGNVALFVPLGMCLQVLTRWSVKSTVLLGIAVSLVVETLQFLWSRGTSTTGDVILNCSGTLVGALVGSELLRKHLLSSTNLQ